MKLIFEKSVPGKRAWSLPALDVPEQPLTDLIPKTAIRQEPAALPEVSELEVVRHFTQLARRNHAIDVDFYPLGSCTMKYNPKVNEDAARLPGFAQIHPLQPAKQVQGALALLHELEEMLCEITGMERLTFQPSAGAHGELVGLMLIKAYHEARGERERNQVIVPDAAHGTNPATAAMVGYEVVVVKSDARGGVDLDSLAKAVGPKTAALMLTNPNTLGLFDENIKEITRLVHEAGGLCYYDGANMNAIMGYARPGDMGFDVVHLNLHKTFSTPHGGGGPGSGPVGVKAHLVPYLPKPLLMKGAEGFYWEHERPDSIGRVRSFSGGNFGVNVRAYAYALAYGHELKQVSEYAVLNANYVMQELKGVYDLPYDRFCKHEVVLSAKTIRQETGVRTLDIAKRLLDEGIHPPTVYFPLIVDEALMIEPTETEDKATLDRFIAAMKAIAKEAYEVPEKVKAAPATTPVGRLNEAQAARRPDLRYRGATE